MRLRYPDVCTWTAYLYWTDTTLVSILDAALIHLSYDAQIHHLTYHTCTDTVRYGYGYRIRTDSRDTVRHIRIRRGISGYGSFIQKKKKKKGKKRRSVCVRAHRDTDETPLKMCPDSTRPGLVLTGSGQSKGHVQVPLNQHRCLVPRPSQQPSKQTIHVHSIKWILFLLFFFSFTFFLQVELVNIEVKLLC